MMAIETSKPLLIQVDRRDGLRVVLIGLDDVGVIADGVTDAEAISEVESTLARLVRSALASGSGYPIDTEAV